MLLIHTDTSVTIYKTCINEITTVSVITTLNYRYRNIPYAMGLDSNSADSCPYKFVENFIKYADIVSFPVTVQRPCQAL